MGRIAGSFFFTKYCNISLICWFYFFNLNKKILLALPCVVPLTEAFLKILVLFFNFFWKSKLLNFEILHLISISEFYISWGKTINKWLFQVFFVFIYKIIKVLFFLCFASPHLISLHNNTKILFKILYIWSFLYYEIGYVDIWLNYYDIS